MGQQTANPAQPIADVQDERPERSPVHEPLSLEIDGGRPRAGLPVGGASNAFQRYLRPLRTASCLFPGIA
jgi:hypothetical protein